MCLCWYVCHSCACVSACVCAGNCVVTGVCVCDCAGVGVVAGVYVCASDCVEFRLMLICVCVHAGVCDRVCFVLVFVFVSVSVC